MPRFLLLVLIPIAAAAANPTASLDSQARAQRILNAAVTALGGEAELRRLRSIRREYVEDWVDVGQGRRPWSGTPGKPNLPPHAGFDDSDGLGFLDYAGNRYYESIRYADSPTDFAVIADCGTPEHAFQTITYVRERPFLTMHPAEELERQRIQHFRRHPEGVLRAALNRIETLISLGQVAEEGGRLIAGRKTVLDDGGQRVELYDFGPAPHVDQILVAYFPSKKLLHVADLLDVLMPELVIAGVDAVVMDERIREFGLDVERIVPMHGVPVTIEHLQRGLEIRRKYQESVP